MNNRRLNIWGLIFGMAGVVVLFVWGPPQPTLETGVGIGLEDGNVIDQKTGQTVADYNREINRKRACYNAMSKVGLGLVGVGFFCQWLAAYRTK